MTHAEVLAEYLAAETLTVESISNGSVPIGLLVERPDKPAVSDVSVSASKYRDGHEDYPDAICRTETIDLIAEGQKMLDPKLISKPQLRLDVRTTSDPILPITVFTRPK